MQVYPATVVQILNEEVAKLQETVKTPELDTAKHIFEKILFHPNQEFCEFMSLYAYPYIVTSTAAAKL